MIRGLIASCAVVLAALGCESAIAPPGEIPRGSIRAHIVYEGEWPPLETIADLRFVAFRFIPCDTADIIQLNRLEFSTGLGRPADEQVVYLIDVPAAVYPVSGVVRQRDPDDALSWEPLGLYEEDGGIFVVPQKDTVRVEVQVDFANPPPFPPEECNR